MSTILVTGGAGFIGSNVADIFMANDHKVVVVDNLSSGKLQNINREAMFHQVDLREAKLKSVFVENKIDWVCHHAAQIDVRKSVDDPQYDAQVNIVGMLNLLECCRQHQVKGIIFASSGGAIYGEASNLPVSETALKGPLSPYGVSKLTVENYLFYYYRTFNLPYIALRYSNVYGPRQDTGGEAGVIAIFIGRLLNKSAVSIFGDGEQLRDYVFVDDVARANLLALKKLESGFNPPHGSIDDRAFNIATGIGTSVNQLFAHLRGMVSGSTGPNYEAERPGEIRQIYLEVKKAGEYLAWRPSVKIVDGLQRTLDFWLKNQ